MISHLKLRLSLISLGELIEMCLLACCRSRFACLTAVKASLFILGVSDVGDLSESVCCECLMYRGHISLSIASS